ncbi:hypothetical protein ACFQ6V_06565 [Streptomyces roseifaciens]
MSVGSKDCPNGCGMMNVEETGSDANYVCIPCGYREYAGPATTSGPDAD